MGIFSFLEPVFNLISYPFGLVIRWFNTWTHHYWIAIILFAVVLKIVLFPLGIQQQRNSQKQAKLRPKENIIRKKYAGRTDRSTQMKMNEEIQELYRQESFSPLSGCLPMLLQMLILIAVYAVVRSPLTYCANFPNDLPSEPSAVTVVEETVTYQVFEDEYEWYLATEKGEEAAEPAIRLSNMVTYKLAFQEEKKETDADGNESTKKVLKDKETLLADLKENAIEKSAYQYYAEIDAIRFLGTEENAEDFKTRVVNAYHYTEEQAQALVESFPDLDLFPGFSLGERPSFTFPIKWSWILIVPLLNLATAYLGQFFTRKFTYQPAGQENNPSMKMMNLVMPLFSLYISFIVPVAVSIYWIIQNVLNPLQQFIMSKLFPIPEITPEEMLAAERELAGKTKKKPSSPTGTKRRSLVYDDDDDDTPAPDPSKPVVTEKTEEETKNEKKVVDKAPLKDD